jgi:glycosyl transferase family 87
MNKPSWLRFLLIDPTKLKDKKYLFAVIGIFLFLVFLAIRVGIKVGPWADSNVFWNAGRNFFYRNDLYSGIGGAQRYIYPPFAAMIFQVLAIFPMKVASTLLAFFNLLLIFFIIYLVKSILEFYFDDKNAITYSLLFGTILSFRFFWYHYVYIQMNEPVLALCLIGVLLLLKKKETPAIICFVIATFIKIIPVFFIIWLLIRGNFKTYIKVGIATLLCFIIPLIWRGFDLGMQDLKHYYQSFIEPFQNGKVEAYYSNESLSSSIYKIFIPEVDEWHYDFSIIQLPLQIVKRINLVCIITLFLSFVSCIAYLRFTKKTISFLEISLILLATHLLSGITWDYHLVSLIFVYTTFIILRKEMKTPISKIFFWFIIIIMTVNSIAGTDTIGEKTFRYFQGYGVITWMMLILYFFFLYQCIFRNKDIKV